MPAPIAMVLPHPEPNHEPATAQQISAAHAWRYSRSVCLFEAQQPTSAHAGFRVFGRTDEFWADRSSTPSGYADGGGSEQKRSIRTMIRRGEREAQ
jgi:hypothetical protein